ncbi:hypothetical protein BB559_005320 [Furculomyces boomerangus]|uniref:FAS1 domain-containing protein n=1 Tax=Furculomyces boomerangus TaxID=61424 RepID=A0A2T9Y9F3_9FUNG|nr:hypothetical protein BB559_005320 [Furculomyces boomerangus]
MNTIFVVWMSIMGLCRSQNSLLLDALDKAGNFSIARKYIEMSLKLRPSNAYEYPFTMFVPTNEAFIAAGVGNLTDEKVLTILAYHVLNETVFTSNTTTRVRFFRTYLKTKEDVNLPGGIAQVLGLYNVNNSLKIVDGTFASNATRPNVIRQDIPALKGVFHIVDKVLAVPSDLATVLNGIDRFSTLSRKLKEAGLLDYYSKIPGITLLAPNNEAFKRLDDLNVNNSTANYIPILNNNFLTNKVLYSSKVVGTGKFDTGFTGSSVEISREKSGLIRVGNGFLNVPNILINNGVIQGTNIVILPSINIFSPAISPVGPGSENATGTASRPPNEGNLFASILSLLGAQNGNAKTETPSETQSTAPLIPSTVTSSQTSTILTTVIQETITTNIVSEVTSTSLVTTTIDEVTTLTPTSTVVSGVTPTPSVVTSTRTTESQSVVVATTTITGAVITESVTNFVVVQGQETSTVIKPANPTVVPIPSIVTAFVTTFSTNFATVFVTQINSITEIVTNLQTVTRSATITPTITVSGQNTTSLSTTTTPIIAVSGRNTTSLSAASF